VARPATGSLKRETLVDGTLAFRLRFPAFGTRETVVLHERRDCDCECGGGWTERTARVELETILVKVKAGIWERPVPQTVEPRFKGMPWFEEYAEYWLKAKTDGILGEKALSKNSQADYRASLKHLIPFFRRCRLNQIDGDVCLEFKAHKLKEAQELAAAIAAGADIRDARKRRIKPIGPSSLRKYIRTLAAIMEEAVEDKYIDVNPARGRRLKVKVPKPKRSFLERDELVCIEDAAGDQDPSLAAYAVAASNPDGGESERAVAAALADGLRPQQVAQRLGLSKATVGFHCKKFGGSAGVYVGRRAIVLTLGRSGVRVSELCAIEIGQLVLRGVEGSRFDIPDSKTDTGIREVEMTGELVQEIEAHIDRLRRAGFDTGPKAPLFPNHRYGTSISRQRVAEILTEAATLADERLGARGLRPLPHVTPHTMRRTYISIALIANEFDVKWVQDQVGHSDSKMTLDVYAQLQQRAKREHGTRFDKLMQEGRASLYRNDAEPGKDPEEGVWDVEWDVKPQNRPATLVSRQRGDHQNGSNAGHSRRPNTPFGLGTTRFSVECSTS
jgi:integrase